MRLSSEQITALGFAKEITVAKLSQASPGSTNGESGKAIGDMFTEVYKAILIAMTEEQ